MESPLQTDNRSSLEVSCSLSSIISEVKTTNTIVSICARRLYNEASLVHGDLNETNVLVVPKHLFELRTASVVVSDSKGQDASVDQVVLIDFGQTVDSGHPDAKDLLQRDLQCVRHFFVKQGIRTPSVEDTLKHVLDGNIAVTESKMKPK